jgi:hypothetical protein
MSTTKTVTSKGYKVVGTVHPMHAQGYRYRFTNVSGNVHVDEYVAPVGQWVWLGYLAK